MIFNEIKHHVNSSLGLVRGCIPLCPRLPGRSTADHISLFRKFSTNRGSRLCQRCLHMFCRPRESMRPGSSWKALGSVAGVRWWRLPVTGGQTTVFLVRNLCPCRKGWITITTVQITTWVLDADKGVCCHHSSWWSISGITNMVPAGTRSPARSTWVARGPVLTIA